MGDYTNREISTIRQSLIDKIVTLTSDWQDYNEADLGMVFIEFIAAIGDELSFYMDHQALETYLDTAVQDKNIRALLRTMNYRIPLIGGAKGSVRVTFENPVEVRSLVPRYTPLYCSAEDIYYCTSENVYISAGATYIDLNVEQGIPKKIVTTKSAITSSLTGRRIYLNSKIVSEGSVQIDQSGEIWEEVDDALLKYNGGRFYSMHRDSNGLVYLLLPCNYLDMLPGNASEEITINYIETLGLDGVVAFGKIDTVPIGTSTFGTYNLSAYGNVIVSVLNSASTYGAWGDIDLNQAKILARRQAQLMDRYITLGDYENAILTEPYVMKCVVADWKTSSYVTFPYTVKVWAVDWTGNGIGPVDIASLKEKLELKGVSSIKVEVDSVTRVPIDMNIGLVLKTTNTSIRDKVKKLVEDNIEMAYDVGSLEFGKKISVSQIISTVMNSSGYIEDCVLESPENDIIVGDVQFPYLNSLSVEFI